MWGLLMVPIAIGFAIFSAKNAAMRGTKRKPLPEWVDKVFRSTFLFMFLSPVFMYAPLPWWITLLLFLLYLPSYLDGTERYGGRPSEFAMSWSIWHWLKRRLNMKLVRTIELDPKNQYILGIHPHGILPFGSIVNLCSNVNNAKELLKGLKLRTLAASFCFYLPGYRDLLLAGGVMDAARYVARRVIDNGFSIFLVPGGATEALYADIGANTLVLKKRLGFIKLAMETGAHLVPVYCFGENDTYGVIANTSPLGKKIMANFQSVFGISLPLITNIIPRSCHVTTVIGAPIPVTKTATPTQEAMQELLDVYIEQLTELFEANKAKYAAPGAKLAIL